MVYSRFFLAVICPSGWYKESVNSNKCLKIVNQTQPMFAAKFACNVYGANASILSIENAFENAEITSRSPPSLFLTFFRANPKPTIV